MARPGPRGEAGLRSARGVVRKRRIVKLMYFDKPEVSEPLVAGHDIRVMLSVNGLTRLVLGMFPGGLMSACSLAIG